jgi:4-phosphopantoate--beta-alanine ligase
MTTVPETHPRYRSLIKRERIIEFWKKGIVADAGLIAHGRGEAFDYIIGEATMPFAEDAERAAVAYLLTAHRPVISVNGNVTALAAREVVELARLTGAAIEVNLFYRTQERAEKIAGVFRSLGMEILGVHPDVEIPGLDHARAMCSRDGIYSADVVLVPLEDGDRAQALVAMGKTVLTVDLNPLSRTARVAHVTVVDELTRAMANMVRMARERDFDPDGVIASYRNDETLARCLLHIKKRMEELGVSCLPRHRPPEPRA